MSSAALDRQIRPIYGPSIHTLWSTVLRLCVEALDTGSNKSAILACNKLLKKHPKNDMVKVPPSLRFAS